MKIRLFAPLGIIALSIMACSKGSDEKTPAVKAQAVESINKPFHGGVTSAGSAVPGTPIADELKKKKLNANSTKTVGEAFDSYKYAIKKEWRETSTRNGPYYADYICWLDISPVSTAALKDGVVKRGLEIKFVIHENGEAYIAMATKIEIKSDGKLYATPYEVADIEKIISAIYENREITF